MIIEKSTYADLTYLPDLTQTRYPHPFQSNLHLLYRYLIPKEYTFQMFQAVIRKKLQLAKEDALYMYFENNKMYSNGKIESVRCSL